MSTTLTTPVVAAFVFAAEPKVSPSRRTGPGYRIQGQNGLVGFAPLQTHALGRVLARFVYPELQRFV